MGTDLLWPPYSSPQDLAAIEAIPLAERGLPDSTYAVLKRAADLWPDRTSRTHSGPSTQLPAIARLPERNPSFGRSRHDNGPRYRPVPGAS